MVYHGGNLSRAARDFQIEITDWLDLSTGINPHAYPFSLPESQHWCRLPGEEEVHALLKAAQMAYDVPSFHHIQAMPGTQAILTLLPHILPQKGAVRILGPTYKEHLNSWRLSARPVQEVLELEDMIENAEIGVIVNPDNPSGRTFDEATLCDIADHMAQKGAFLIVDAAFADCQLTPHLKSLYERPNVMVLRSFGKFYGLAGLRLCFAIARPDLIDQIKAWAGPWGVSGPALSIGRAALSDGQWADQMRARLDHESRKLDEVLIAKGLTVEGGTSLFRFCACANGAALYEKLGRQGILIRPFEDFPHHVRIGLPASQVDLDRLKNSL